MRKKILIIICGIILVIILGIVFNSIKSKKECIPFTGGSFILKVNKNNGEDIESISICIACSPDSYEKIENPSYEGYTFLGWYYDEDFKEKAEFDTALDIEPIQEIDEDGCFIGYKTREIFAKWGK